MIMTVNGKRYDTYDDYLGSEEWQAKRSLRLKMDHYKCQKCGCPMNLQVHHLTYSHIGFEDVSTDLITFCRNCHEEIETNKAKYDRLKVEKAKAEDLDQRRKQYSDGWEAARVPELEFCRQYENKDRSSGGTLNLTDFRVIRYEYGKWAEENGVSDETLRVTTISNYFRDKRILLIVSMANAGASPDEIMGRGISRNMVMKYYNNTDLAKAVISTNETGGL